MYVGLETSSTSLNVAVLDDDGRAEETVAIDRFELAESSGTILDRIGEHVDPGAVDMAAVCFAWGDALPAVRPVGAVSNRGNRGTSGFLPKPEDAAAFDELADAGFPCVVVPGVSDRLECLHPYFRHYAQLSGPDQVGAARYAQRVTDRAGGEGETFVSANASSSTRALVVADGRLRGAFHWAGLIHGWPDGDVFDAILRGEVDPRLAAQRAGFLYKPGTDHAEWPVPGDRDDVDASCRRVIADDLAAAADDEALLELVYWATLHDVFSLVPFATLDVDTPLEHVVVGGRLARVESPFDVRGRLRSALSTLAPTTVAEPFAAAKGTALVAHDVVRGAESVLGVPVEV